MFARVVHYAGGDPTRVEEIIAAVRDRLTPEVTPALDDAKSFWMFVDRQKAQIFGITMFETREELRRGMTAMDKLPDPAPEAGGRRVSVDVYEVALAYDRDEEVARAG
jgi:hypothetical protein